MFSRKVFILTVFLFLFAYKPALAAADVSSVTRNATSVGKFQKFELTFQLSRTFPAGSFLPYYPYDPSDNPTAFPGRQSPYEVDGITVNAHFVAPSGKESVVPAFYFQDYTRTQAGNGDEVMTPLSTYSWKVRFTPTEVGTYSYWITTEDKTGTSRYPASGGDSLTVTQSSLAGFVRVSTKDSRFLEFDNGESFIPVAAGQQWWPDNSRSYGFERIYNEFGANGINLTRIWDQNDGYSLTVEGHFDNYKWPDDSNPENRIPLDTIPKGTQMNQRGGYELDKTFEAAEKNGVKIIMSQHNDPWWIWDITRENFTDPLRDKYWYRTYRYRVARWGYSTSLLAYENWNEMGHVAVGSATANFLQRMRTYLTTIDTNRHMFTTSQGSQAYSPGLYSQSYMDYVSYHDYLMSSRYAADLYGDEANFLYRAAQCLRFPGTSGCFFGDGSKWTGAQKPIYWGEFDANGPLWSDPGISDSRIQHNGLWAGLFSVAGSSPIDWNQSVQTASDKALIRSDRKVASNFFKGVDYAGSNFQFMATSDVILRPEITTLTATNAKLRVLGMRAQNALVAYAWVQNKDARWQGVASPAPVSGSFVIPGLKDGSYNVETWDTANGQITKSTATSTAGSITIPVNSLSKDVAIKIISATQTIPTSTPVPVAVVGDANGDSKVDGIDYIFWFNNYGTTTTQKAASGDFDGNGKVDGLDYIYWLNNYK